MAALRRRPATLFSRFGGIQRLEAGYRRFAVRPAAIDSLAWVRVRVETIRGRLESKWEHRGTTLTLELEVPVGAEAEVYMPAGGPDDVFESGVPAAQAPGVKFLGKHDQAEVYCVGSGVYRFHTGQE